MQYIKITSRPPSSENKEVEQVEPVQMNTYQSNTLKTEKTLAYYISAMSQGFKKVKHLQSCICVFVAFSTIPSSNWKHEKSISYMPVW